MTATIRKRGTGRASRISLGRREEKQYLRHLIIFATDCLPSSVNRPNVCIDGRVNRASIEKVAYGLRWPQDRSNAIPMDRNVSNGTSPGNFALYCFALHCLSVLSSAACTKNEPKTTWKRAGQHKLPVHILFVGHAWSPGHFRRYRTAAVLL